jgi:hypothetical protein
MQHYQLKPLREINRYTLLEKLYESTDKKIIIEKRFVRKRNDFYFVAVKRYQIDKDAISFNKKRENYYNQMKEAIFIEGLDCARCHQMKPHCQRYCEDN